MDEARARQHPKPFPSDEADAEAFLRREATALEHALEAAPDEGVHPAVVELDHELWLALIATLHARGQHDAADEIGGLYGFHGRVLTCLERGVDPRLGAAVASRVQGLLVNELERRTTTACLWLPALREIVVS